MLVGPSSGTKEGSGAYAEQRAWVGGKGGTWGGQHLVERALETPGVNHKEV